jgi:thymidylate synthase (FAD)
MIADGVCPEQARFVLPQGCEVQWIWTGNLYAFANFYLKRTDPHAQKEIQDLARMVGDIIEPLFPVSWKALTNG